MSLKYRIDLYLYKDYLSNSTNSKIVNSLIAFSFSVNFLFAFIMINFIIQIYVFIFNYKNLFVNYFKLL